MCVGGGGPPPCCQYWMKMRYGVWYLRLFILVQQSFKLGDEIVKQKHVLSMLLDDNSQCYVPRGNNAYGNRCTSTHLQLLKFLNIT